MHRGSILCIVHQRFSYPGRLGRLFMEQGFLLDVRCPQLGQALPETLDAYTATLRWIPTRSATRSSKPDLNVISKLGEHGLDGCFESEALSRR